MNRRKKRERNGARKTSATKQSILHHVDVAKLSHYYFGVGFVAVRLIKIKRLQIFMCVLWLVADNCWQFAFPLFALSLALNSILINAPLRCTFFSAFFASRWIRVDVNGIVEKKVSRPEIDIALQRLWARIQRIEFAKGRKVSINRWNIDHIPS